MAGYKHNQLKNKSFIDIQKLFNKAMKRVNTFVDVDTELVEGSKVRAEAEIAQKSSSKRACTEQEQESIKKQKVNEDKETTELQRLIEVVPNKDEVAIDAIHLATKLPSILDYKIHKEGKKTYYQITRTDRSSKMYLVFSHMLKSFDREDLETLWKLVKAQHGSTRPKEGYGRVLWGDLKTMFDPHVEDQILKKNIKFRGGLLGLKDFLMILELLLLRINVDDHTIEQYLRLTHENQTPSMVKKVDDMTIAEYIEYEERVKRQYNRKLGSYFLTYSSHCTSSNNTTIEFPCIADFNPIQLNNEFNYDSEDMKLDEEARYTTDEESVMSEHEAINLAHTVNTQSFEEELSFEKDLDEWLKVEMEKHMSKQNEKNKEDALIAIIKSIREECMVVHKNKQISASKGADLKKSSETMEDTINNDSFASNLLSLEELNP
ncbi:hypothetical protein Tco_1162508 [Tanacetum coccineum]